jgi:hypothetical protein
VSTGDISWALIGDQLQHPMDLVIVPLVTIDIGICGPYILSLQGGLVVVRHPSLYQTAAIQDHLNLSLLSGTA